MTGKAAAAVAAAMPGAAVPGGATATRKSPRPVRRLLLWRLRPSGRQTAPARAVVITMAAAAGAEEDKGFGNRGSSVCWGPGFLGKKE